MTGMLVRWCAAVGNGTGKRLRFGLSCGLSDRAKKFAVYFEKVGAARGGVLAWAGERGDFPAGGKIQTSQLRILH
jgi:hypothetical protein